jgi:hypothetical protein
MTEATPVRKRSRSPEGRRQMVAYKFDLATRNLIDELAAERGVSKTMLVEMALESYARKSAPAATPAPSTPPTGSAPRR